MTGNSARVLAPLLDPLSPVSLETLDERAPLLQRIDHKYVIEWDTFVELLARLGDDHDVLEVAGRRASAYRSVYFDTDDLRCFREHRDGVLPRFKARTRLYVDTGACVFEVKLKQEGGETDKRQVEHPADRAAELLPEARELVDAVLADAGVAPAPDLEPRLQTAFDRVTLAARDGSERVTADLGVRLSQLGDGAVSLRPELVVVETKSEDGAGAGDEAMAALGAEPVSLSKYRLGVDALLERDDTGELDAVRGLFA